MALKEMMNQRHIIGVIFMLLCIPNLMHAQVESQGRPSEYIQQIFGEVFTFQSGQPGKGRVDIYIQIPYPEINFIKESDSYIGKLDISVSVLTPNNEQVWQKNQMVELRVKEFSQTISDRLSSVKQLSTDLLPGKYDILIQVTDQETKKVASFRKSLDVRDMGKDSLGISDLMLVHRVNNDGVRRNIVPNLTGIIGKEPGFFFLFFEIYKKVPIDSVNLTCKVINSAHHIVNQNMFYEHLDENRTQTVWKIDTPALIPDQYTLKVEVEGYAQGKFYQSSISRSFLVRMKNIPSTITDVDKATDQLVYITRGDELDYIREGTTPEEKLKRFLEFWSKHDPDPKTSRNELMEEYYARVAYADRNFGNYMEGWKSDRGMVLITYGPPENVERHPFDSDSKPYEVWYYYEQNREFIFVDESGFGDYRLRYPTTDLWGRIR